MHALIKLRWLTVILLLVTLGVSAASLLLPQPPGADAREFYNPLATSISLIDMGLGIANSVLFFRARRNFKPQLRLSYLFLATAALTTGVMTLVFPITEYYGLWDVLFFNVASYAPYFFGSILMYLGARMFYRALGFRGPVASIRIVVPVILVLWAIYAQTPHAEGWPTETIHDSMQLVALTPVLLYGASAYLLFRVAKTIGHEYRRSLVWMVAGFCALTLSSLSIIMLEIIGYDNWYFNDRWYVIPTILADVLVLIAGYHFNKIGIAAGHKDGDQVSSVDIVSYVAGLAGDPTKIEAHTESLREVTAHLKPGQTTLSDEDQTKLLEAYVGIEKYLVNDDQLRTFTQEDLRNNITEYFGLHDDKITFWPRLTAN